MRTHLLRTFYPSPAAEPETGSAANDAKYDTPAAAKDSGARVMALMPAANRETLSAEDEYALGGYADI
jgi:hypothetical protein